MYAIDTFRSKAAFRALCQQREALYYEKLTSANMATAKYHQCQHNLLALYLFTIKHSM